MRRPSITTGRRPGTLVGLLAAVSVAVGAAPAAGQGLTAPQAVSCGGGLLGDVTGDGNVNIIDAQQIARWAVGLTVNATVEGRIATHGDVTGDGKVNIIDAQQIARWAVGFTTSFPIGEPLPACEGIRVTTSTTGQDLDPDGYDVFLDGTFASDIGVSGVVDLTSAAPGSHTVTLQGLASNCSITNGPSARDVTVVEGESVSVDYTVECTGTGQGTLEVRNTTDGAQPSSPYSVTLDGGSTKSMPVGGTVTFEGVSFGSHQVTLGNVPAGCTVSGGATQTVSVQSGFNILHYSVSCSAPAPMPMPIPMPEASAPRLP